MKIKNEESSTPKYGLIKLDETKLNRIRITQLFYLPL